MLAERSADLGPLCARKLYHIGDHETRVLDLANTLNAPLEPYVSPLGSPESPGHSLKYQYENPLKLFKDIDLGPVQTHDIDNGYDADTNETGVKRKSDMFGSLPSVSHGKTASGAKYNSTPNIENQMLLMTVPDFKQDSNTKTYDSEYSPISKLVRPNEEVMELSVAPLQAAALQSKRAHSTDRTGVEQPKSKFLRTVDGELNGSFDIGSVKSGSTDDPRSSVTRSHDRDRDDSMSLSSHPATEETISLANQMLPSQRSSELRQIHGEAKPHPDDSENVAIDLTILSPDMVTLKQRKEAALSPYKPKSKYLASKFGTEEKTEKDYFETLANELLEDPNKNAAAETSVRESVMKSQETTRLSRSPVKADHRLGRGETKMDTSPSFRSTPSYEGRGLYKPRSPSPLTLPPMSRSHHDLSPEKRSSSTDKPSQRSSSVERMKGHRSLSPRIVAMTTRHSRSFAPENQDSMSKSLTAGQMRSMGAPGNKDKNNKEAWDPVGVCCLQCQGHFEIIVLSFLSTLFNI